jgi:hypothetical protein
MNPAPPKREILRVHTARLTRGQLPGGAGEARWLALDPGKRLR